MKIKWQDVRAALLFLGGLYLAVYEVQFSAPPVEVPTLILAAGMMGLEGVLRS